MSYDYDDARSDPTYEEEKIVHLEKALKAAEQNIALIRESARSVCNKLKDDLRVAKRELVTAQEGHEITKDALLSTTQRAVDAEQENERLRARAEQAMHAYVDRHYHAAFLRALNQGERLR